MGAKRTVGKEGGRGRHRRLVAGVQGLAGLAACLSLVSPDDRVLGQESPTTGGAIAARTEGMPALRIDADRGTIELGDPLRLLVWLVAPAGMRVELPELGAPLGDFELLSHRPAEAITLASGLVRHQRQWTVTAFDVGPAQLPPLTARLHAGAETFAIVSDTLTIEVASLLAAAAADSLTDIRALKGLIDLPVPPDWRPWAGAALLLLLLGVAWFGWQRRRRRLDPRRLGPIDLRPADEWALDELACLRRDDLPERVAFSEHYTRLIDIVRPYLERRFHVRAVEQTSGEIIAALAASADAACTDEQATVLGELFAEADLVKFAKHRPPAPDAVGAIDRAADFVRATARRRHAAAGVD